MLYLLDELMHLSTLVGSGVGRKLFWPPPTYFVHVPSCSPASTDETSVATTIVTFTIAMDITPTIISASGAVYLVNLLTLTALFILSQETVVPASFFPTSVLPWPPNATVMALITSLVGLAPSPASDFDIAPCMEEFPVIYTPAVLQMADVLWPELSPEGGMRSCASIT